jgi:plastocyanin
MYGRTRRAAIAGLLIGTLALAAACGGDDDSDGASSNGGDNGGNGDHAITLEAREFAFAPDDVTVDAGEVEVTLDNKGVVEHDFTIDEADVQVYADATESTTETVTIDEGTYTFYCSIPGHREAGMEGTLTAE